MPTGSEGYWNITVLNWLSDKTAFREFTGEIAVTNDVLYLINYENLTIAAQFQDERLPSNHNAGLVIKRPNGNYTVLVRQMFHPDGYLEQSEDAAFEIVLQMNA